MSKKNRKSTGAGMTALPVREECPKPKKSMPKWLATVITIVLTAIATETASWIVRRVSPVDPRIEAYIKNLNASTEHMAVWTELARHLTGNVDSQTVERVKGDVVTHFRKVLSEYPTKEEFMKEKHRYCDKEKGVIWETGFRNGNMYSYVVAPYTNGVDAVK